jgi:hypothetical protein
MNARFTVAVFVKLVELYVGVIVTAPLTVPAVYVAVYVPPAWYAGVVSEPWFAPSATKPKLRPAAGTSLPAASLGVIVTVAVALPSADTTVGLADTVLVLASTPGV